MNEKPCIKCKAPTTGHAFVPKNPNANSFPACWECFVEHRERPRKAYGWRWSRWPTYEELCAFKARGGAPRVYLKLAEEEERKTH
jgi:hypothetical protein